MERTTIRRMRKRKADNKIYLCAAVSVMMIGFYTPAFVSSLNVPVVKAEK